MLSVSYDRPGMQITYIGYFLLFAGFVLTLFSKKSRFGRLRRELGEMKKNAPFCLLLFLGYPVRWAHRRHMHRKRFLLRSYLAFLLRMPGNSAVWYCSIRMVALNLSTVTLPPFCANFTERTS